MKKRKREKVKRRRKAKKIKEVPGMRVEGRAKREE